MQPLALRVRAARVAGNAVYIGNAAQTLHPVAGQGLNLGLRDAWDLSRAFVDRADPGDAATLARYAARRRLDAARRSASPMSRRRFSRARIRCARAARGAGAHRARYPSGAAAIFRAPHDLRRLPRCREKSNSGRASGDSFCQAKRIKFASLFLRKTPRPMRIGAHVLRSGLFVAPMAGITDRPFRRLARRYGAALAVSEMVSSRPELRESRKTRLRIDHSGEPGPIAVQIAGADPADARRCGALQRRRWARRSSTSTWAARRRRSATCAAGSALLEDEALVARILEAVVAAVDVPVTLKIRTGPRPERRNARAHRAHRRGRRRADARHPRPHPGLRVRRPCRVRDHRRGEVARCASR